MAWYRSILEVQKFLPAKDVLQVASVVSSSWHRAAESEELWQHLCDASKAAFRLKTFTSIRLALVKSGSVQCFNCVTACWEPAVSLHAAVEVDFSSSVTFLSDASVLVCGGMSTSNATLREAARIHRDGNVTTLQPMSSRRANHGMIEAAGIVYVFGGRCKETSPSTLDSCEKWRVPTDSAAESAWEGLPNMHKSRWGFNPCSYRGLIYLFGSSVEVFDTATNSFWILATTGENRLSQASLYVCEERLFVLQTNRLDVVSLSDGRALESTGIASTFANSAMTPVRVASTVYMVEYVTGMVFAFDLSMKVSMSYMPSR